MLKTVEMQARQKNRVFDKSVYYKRTQPQAKRKIFEVLRSIYAVLTNPSAEVLSLNSLNYCIFVI